MVLSPTQIFIAVPRLISPKIDIGGVQTQYSCGCFGVVLPSIWPLSAGPVGRPAACYLLSSMSLDEEASTTAHLLPISVNKRPLDGRRIRTLATSLVYTLVILLGISFIFHIFIIPKARNVEIVLEPEIDDFQNPDALLAIETLFSRQSKTLSQASARYALKTGREPPPHYDEWFRFATNRSCLIDEYDQIHRDFAAFYQIAEENPKWFRKRLNKVKDLAMGWEGHWGTGLIPAPIRNGSYGQGHPIIIKEDWDQIMNVDRVSLSVPYYISNMLLTE